jgi:hypothetical protein
MKLLPPSPHLLAINAAAAAKQPRPFDVEKVRAEIKASLEHSKTESAKLLRLMREG